MRFFCLRCTLHAVEWIRDDILQQRIAAIHAAKETIPNQNTPRLDSNAKIMNDNVEMERNASLLVFLRTLISFVLICRKVSKRSQPASHSWSGCWIVQTSCSSTSSPQPSSLRVMIKFRKSEIAFQIVQIADYILNALFFILTNCEWPSAHLYHPDSRAYTALESAVSAGNLIATFCQNVHAVFVFRFV